MIKYPETGRKAMDSDGLNVEGIEEYSEEAVEWLTRAKELYRDKYGSTKEWEKERDILVLYAQRLVEEIRDDYVLEEPIGLGSTAIVSKIQQKSTGQKLALKLNRPLDDPDDVDRVKNEATTLPNLNHTNIIRCIDTGHIKGVDPEATFLIEPLVSNPVDLDEYIEEKRAKIESIRLERDSEKGEARILLNDVIGDIVTFFRQVTEAIDHMHNRNYLHLDIKPENVLVSEEGNITLIDLGSAEKLDPEGEATVPVYFTERYGHPDLVQDHERKTSSNRLKAGRKISELSTKLDYYALGMSILETLNRIGTAAPNDAPQLPKFKALHLLGTRLLVSENSHQRGVPEGGIVDQFYGRLSKKDYSTLQYRDLENVIIDFKKEEGLWNLEQKIPELDDYSKEVLRINPDMNIVLTPRLLKIIEHPLFARLKLVRQLGLITFLYPSADHARFDHVLGTYRQVCSYVKSLFHDEHNPLFRNLVREEDLKAILLTSLLHDLGQYPLAHDLQEVDDDIFSHEKLSLRLLGHTPQGSDHSIGDIIENESWGWNVDTNYIRKLLGVSTPGFQDDSDVLDFKVDMLAALIDGPIDADKADYIVRDTEECGLTYGKQLDFDRLLRTITVARLQNSGNPRRKRVTVGVYDKGFPTAQSFGQARYELLSTVYWHHTSRSIKCMLQYSLSRILYGEDSPELDEERRETLKSQLFDLVVSMTPVHPVQDIINTTEPPEENPHQSYTVDEEPDEDVLEALHEEDSVQEAATFSNYPEGAWHPGVGWTDSLMIDWLSSRGNDSQPTENLLNMLKSRSLYKRVIEVKKGRDNERLVKAVRSLDWKDKLDLQQELQKEILSYIEGHTKEIWGSGGRGTSTPRGRRSSDTYIQTGEDRISKLLKNEMSVLVDAPKPDEKLGYEPKDELVTVPTLQTKQYYQETEEITRQQEWTENLESMLEMTSPVRVYAHPDLRRLLCSQIGPVDMRQFLWDAVEEVAE